MKRPPATTPISLNLAPMVDVMMCLLVFFMLATKMVEQENSHIDLPVAFAAKEVEKQELGDRLVINIRDAVLHGGTGVDYVIRETVVPYAHVCDRLKLEAERHPEVNCVIRADRTIAYRYVEAVMVACAQANVRHITFGALPRERGAG
jgi:biopolymer transport protein ExbD